MAADILKTLKDEHDLVRDLFKKMEETTERAEKTRPQLLEQIKDALLPHAAWEEQFFYPEFKKRADRDGLKSHAEAISEHRAVELRACALTRISLECDNDLVHQRFVVVAAEKRVGRVHLGGRLTLFIEELELHHWAPFFALTLTAGETTTWPFLAPGTAPRTSSS